MEGCSLGTYDGKDDYGNVSNETKLGFDEKLRNRAVKDDGGRDGGCEKKLHWDNDVNLANESPTKLRAFDHHGVKFIFFMPNIPPWFNVIITFVVSSHCYNIILHAIACTHVCTTEIFNVKMANKSWKKEKKKKDWIYLFLLLCLLEGRRDNGDGFCLGGEKV